MKNCDLIFKKAANVRTNVYLNDGRVIIKNKKTTVNGKTLARMLSDVAGAINKYPDVNFRITLDLGRVSFADKLTYILLECLCYTVINDYHKEIELKIDAISSGVGTNGIKESCLKYITCQKKTRQQTNTAVFTKEFLTPMITKSRFRKILSYSPEMDQAFLSKLMGDIKTFLTAFTEDEMFRSNIAEVAVELVGNALEHTQDDCLIDVDIACPVEGSSIPRYSGINIIVLNFSQKKLGDGVKKKITKLLALESLPERYGKIELAFRNHSKCFSEAYKESDFYNLCSFQNKISERLDKSGTGGTGLALLIDSLEKRSDVHLCYVFSGKRILYFQKNYLEYNDDGWIGFNDTNDFVNSIPNKKNLSCSDFYMPGTAYNLNFFIKQEEAENEQQRK